MLDRKEVEKAVKLLKGKEDPDAADVEKALGRKPTLSDFAVVGFAHVFEGLKTGAEENAKEDGRGEEEKVRADAAARAEVTVGLSIDGRRATVKVVAVGDGLEGDDDLEGDDELLRNRRAVRAVARRLADEVQKTLCFDWFRRAIEEEEQARLKGEPEGRA